MKILRFLPLLLVFLAPVSPVVNFHYTDLALPDGCVGAPMILEGEYDAENIGDFLTTFPAKVLRDNIKDVYMVKYLYCDGMWMLGMHYPAEEWNEIIYVEPPYVKPILFHEFAHVLYINYEVEWPCSVGMLSYNCTEDFAKYSELYFANREMIFQLARYDGVVATKLSMLIQFYKGIGVIIE